MKPSGFKLWVNWIQLVQPHLGAQVHAGECREARELLLDCLRVAWRERREKGEKKGERASAGRGG